jgi:hypothetical protein
LAPADSSVRKTHVVVIIGNHLFHVQSCLIGPWLKVHWYI